MEALSSSEVFLFDDFRLYRRGGGLFRRDQSGGFAPVAVGSRGLDILGVLVANAGAIVSKEEIIAAVWPSTVVEDSNLTVQIAALRRVLDRDRTNDSCIQTVSGRGYRFVVAVTHPAVGVGAPRLSIVVLPFTNLSNVAEEQYFADGITEDLTTDLSRIADMFVISSNTAFTYQGKRVDTRQIGRELGVRYVLEGSVRRSGNRVRINAQLIDAETNVHLWAERFDGDTSDLFALQDEVTSRIAVELNLELISVAAARPTVNPDALDYSLKGRAALLKPPSLATSREAIGLFERALALDPQSVDAQSRLASVLAGRVLDNMTDTAAADLVRAEGLAARALAGSPRSPLPHYAKGQLLRAQRRYAEAIPEYEAQLAFNRNSVHALWALGQCYSFTGLVEKAIPLFERAIRLSPRDPRIGIIYFQMGRVHLVQSCLDEALLWLEKARNAMPEHTLPHAYLASAYALKGEAERAAAELAEARRLAFDDRYSSLSRLRTAGAWGGPAVRALYEATYFAGLRKAGMPEE